MGVAPRPLKRHLRPRPRPWLWGVHPIYRRRQWHDSIVGWTARQGEMKHSGAPRSIRHDRMKQKLIGLSQQYVTALRKHLEQGPRASLLPALGLGRRAVVLGLETLDLARIHERAVTALELSSKKDGFIKRAEDFFYRGHHADRGNSSRRAEGQDPIAAFDRDARPAHGGTGRHQPPVAAGHRPAQDAWKPPSRKAANTTPGC